MMSGFNPLADHLRAWREGTLLPKDSTDGCTEGCVAETAAATLLSLAVQPKVQTNSLVQHADNHCTLIHDMWVQGKIPRCLVWAES